MRQLIEIAKQTRSETGFPIASFLEWIDFASGRNYAFHNPANEGKKYGLCHPRSSLLTGCEIVTGDFLVLSYVDHDDELLLTDYDALETLEKSLLSDSGMLNVWNTWQLAFIEQKLRRFEIMFRDTIAGEFVRFDKHSESLILADECDWFADRRLAWLPESQITIQSG